jgi:hypothetical protein
MKRLGKIRCKFGSRIAQRRKLPDVFDVAPPGIYPGRAGRAACFPLLERHAPCAEPGWVSPSALRSPRESRLAADPPKGFVFLRVEDETGISNVIVNPDLYEKYRVVINREKFLRVEGVLQNQDHTISIKGSRVLPISILQPKRSHMISIS